jgi:hypothetical protein
LVGVEAKSIPIEEADKYFAGFLKYIFSTNHQATGSVLAKGTYHNK